MLLLLLPQGGQASLSDLSCDTSLLSGNHAGKSCHFKFVITCPGNDSITPYISSTFDVVHPRSKVRNFLLSSTLGVTPLQQQSSRHKFSLGASDLNLLRCRQQCSDVSSSAAAAAGPSAGRGIELPLSLKNIVAFAAAGFVATLYQTCIIDHGYSSITTQAHNMP